MSTKLVELPTLGGVAESVERLAALLDSWQYQKKTTAEDMHNLEHALEVLSAACVRYDRGLV